MSKLKIPTAKQLPSGSWYVQIRLGDKRVSLTADTEDDAVKKAMLAKLNHAGASAPADVLDKLTVGDAIDSYISMRENILSPSTVSHYIQIKNTRFKSTMSRKLSDYINWQQVINDECELVSPKTVRNAWGLVKSALDEKHVKYSAPDLPSVQSKEPVFLSPSEILVFVDLIKGDRYELPYLLCLHGLRRSEMLAIRKKNIRNGRIYIQGSKVKDKNNKWIYKTGNKNVYSQRSVPIMLDRINELVKKADTEYLCAYSPDGMNKHLFTITKNSDLPSLHFHSLRHSFASLCYHLGLNELECMRLGGWNDVTTMRKIYTHLAAEKISEGEEKLRKFFC